MTVSALYTRHEPLAVKIAGCYFLPGADRQDVQQEARIGLWVAARTWDPGRGASFKTFANKVIHRRLISLVNAALAEKHGPLTNGLRVAHDDDGNMVDITGLCSRDTDTVERIVVGRETLERMVAAVATLSPTEREGLRIAANGEQYAFHGDRRDKRVENAVDRARRKLRKAAA